MLLLHIKGINVIRKTALKILMKYKMKVLKF